MMDPRFMDPRMMDPRMMDPREMHMRDPREMAMQGLRQDAEDGPTPICRCRVLYLGSLVPHVTKDGLQGIQEPLKELYPEDGALGAKGIDSWLSVWSNGFLLENVDENRKKVSRFFPIDSLHYCAAVRYVQVPGTSGEKVRKTGKKPFQDHYHLAPCRCSASCPSTPPLLATPTSTTPRSLPQSCEGPPASKFSNVTSSYVRGRRRLTL